MKETTGEPGRLSCSEAELLLEKRISEEVLSDPEQQGLQQHLNLCRKCHDLVKWISALPEYAYKLSDAEISSAYHTAKENRRRLKRAEHRRRIAMAIVAAVAVVAVVMLHGGLLHSLLSKEEDAENRKRECSPAPPTEPVPGVVMTYCKDREPGALIENGGEFRVSLRNGAVGMLVDPNRRSKRKVTVETPHGEVRVKGTMFTVLVDGENTRVEVFRGVVEFVPTAAWEDSLYATAGQGADLRRRVIFELSRPKTEALRRALDAEVARKSTAEQAPVPDEALTEPTSEVPSEPTESMESDELAGARSERNPVEQPEQVEEGVRSETPAALNRAAPSIDALIQDAQSCLIAHDWTCASSRYQDILKYYPGRPESTAVLVSLAKIELRHLNMPQKALDHYRTYQQWAPNGPMSEEALFGIAETYRRLGEKDMEEETLRLFVERYPKSSQLKRARARLHQLEAGTTR